MHKPTPGAVHRSYSGAAMGGTNNKNAVPATALKEALQGRSLGRAHGRHECCDEVQQPHATRATSPRDLRRKPSYLRSAYVRFHSYSLNSASCHFLCSVALPLPLRFPSLPVSGSAPPSHTRSHEDGKACGDSVLARGIFQSNSRASTAGTQSTAAGTPQRETTKHPARLLTRSHL